MLNFLVRKETARLLKVKQMRGSCFCYYFITIKRHWNKCVTAPGDYILLNRIFKLVFLEQMSQFYSATALKYFNVFREGSLSIHDELSHRSMCAVHLDNAGEGC